MTFTAVNIYGGTEDNPEPILQFFKKRLQKTVWPRAGPKVAQNPAKFWHILTYFYFSYSFVKISKNRRKCLKIKGFGGFFFSAPPGARTLHTLIKSQVTCVKNPLFSTFFGGYLAQKWPMYFFYTKKSGNVSQFFVFILYKIREKSVRKIKKSGHTARSFFWKKQVG